MKLKIDKIREQKKKETQHKEKHKDYIRSELNSKEYKVRLYQKLLKEYYQSLNEGKFTYKKTLDVTEADAMKTIKDKSEMYKRGANNGLYYCITGDMGFSRVITFQIKPNDNKEIEKLKTFIEKSLCLNHTIYQKTM